ncbi:MAG: HAMP domain-containing histidine kinase [Chloracidobacterium sp.]|nr:HAMP domain-containing histidine kinase [Chloracidobacterium sp.]
MKSMGRSWSIILFGVGLLGLLAVLGVLQYRWLSQISDADGDKARKSVQEQAKQFATDFNREIQGAYFNFQTDAESWKTRDWAAFNERYDYWKDKTSYPDLITDFYFFEAKGDSPPLHYGFDSRAFTTAELTDELADLRARFSDEKNFRPIYEDIYTLVLPIHEGENKIGRVFMHANLRQNRAELRLPDKYGYLAIKIDPETIKEKILPALISKYFPEGDFRVAVTRRDGTPVFQSVSGETSDAAAPLLDLSPDNFVFFANKDLLSSIDEGKKKNIVINSRTESRSVSTFDTKDDEKGDVKIEIKRDVSPKRTAVFTTASKTSGDDETPWTLAVQHSSGSIDAFMADTFRRNLAVGLGLLSLLALAIAAIIFSAQRAKLLARRQIDFVSSVSHEFRTPLAVIYSAGENLADGVARENGQVERYGNLIKGEGKKLSTMVEQILEFAGANSGRRKYNFGEVSIDEVIANALDECRPMIDQNHIAVETGISPKLPSINADKTAMSQAIQNLIMNAIKYSNGEAWLRVAAENGDGKVKISVEDRGIGITKKDLRSIFEPFYRSREVVDAQIHGNGLGLSLVKQIAEAHNGRVFVSSEIGKGSKFTIEIPN